MLLGSQALTNDPYFNNVSLLLSARDGVIKDYSKNNLSISTGGNVSVSNNSANAKFGNNSILFDGTGDYLEFPASNFNFGTSPFTIEIWGKFIRRTGDWMQPILANYTASTSGLLIAAFNVTGSYNSLDTAITCGIGDSGSGGNGVNLGYTTTAFSSNAMNYIAVVRNGANSYLYINGSLANTQNIGSSTSINASVANMRIGTSLNIENGTTRTSLNGNLSALRITNNVARYTSNFTVPTQPFPNW